MPYVYKVLRTGDEFETSKECYENELKTKIVIGTVSDPMYTVVKNKIEKPESKLSKIKED